MVMTGVEYSALAVNAGEDTGALPWGEWSLYPYLIHHKGTDYARLYTVDGTLATTYYVDGEPVSRAAFGEYLTPAARRAKRPHGGTVSVKVANLELL
jgi:hypothetical protein